MKVRMIGTHKGSPDGLQINEYQDGEKYELPARLAEIFLDAGMAEEDKEAEQEVKADPQLTKKPAPKKGGKHGSRSQRKR